MDIGLAFAANIEFTVAVCLLLLGISYIVATESWIKYLHVLAQAPESDALIIGCFNALFGVTILSLHWIWGGIPSIVTGVGVLITLRGALHLFHPTWLTLKLKLILPDAQFILKISGLIICFMAVAILYDLFLQPDVQYYWMRPFMPDDLPIDEMGSVQLGHGNQMQLIE